MTLYPMHRPRVGVAVEPWGVAAVSLTHSWLPWQTFALATAQPLDAGVMTVSSLEPNVKDVSALTEAVRAVMGRTRGRWAARPVALIVPDACARLSLFDFDTFPQQPSDQETLLRWRFQKDLAMGMTDTHLAYRLFPSIPGQPRIVRVLAGMIRRGILEQYEAICGAVGCWPAAIGLASLHGVEACRGLLSTLAKQAREVFVVFLSSTAVCLYAFAHGQPVFLRTKSLGGTPEQRRALRATEVQATLQFYRDLSPASSTECDPLVVVQSEMSAAEESEQREAVDLPCRDVQSYALLSPNTAAALHVHEVHVGWEQVCDQWRLRPGPGASNGHIAPLAAIVGA